MKMKTIFQLITLSIIYDASYGQERQLRSNLNAEENRKLQTEEAPIVRTDAQEMILEEPAIATQEETPLEEAPYEPLPQAQEEIPYTGQENTLRNRRRSAYTGTTNVFG